MASPAQLFQRARRFPLGDRIFSRLVTMKSPYFATIRPRFLRLEPGHCEVAAGTMMESSMPRGMRWIPRGMTVRYLKKADTDLVATVTLPRPPAEGESADIEVAARVRNTTGKTVMEADIAMYVSPRRRD